MTLDPVCLYGALEGTALIAALHQAFPGRVAALSSFGAESAVLLDLVAQVDRALPVLFLDTDELFDETQAYRLHLQHHLGLKDVRVIRPDKGDLAEAEGLWRTDADRCCTLRKVWPLAQATLGLAAVIDGRKRSHGAERADLGTVEQVEGLLKASPLARWSEADIERAFVERGLPRHPLVAQGYRSIGCFPCTRAIAAGESPRAGRWAGSNKTECGIHRPGSTSL